MLKSGRGKIKDWQGVVQVRTIATALHSHSTGSFTQFAFHAAMIRDSLTELIHANHVDVLKKVRTGFSVEGSL